MCPGQETDLKFGRHLSTVWYVTVEGVSRKLKMTISIIPMVEVFKTNVNDPVVAGRLVKKIHRAFSGYQANFDLEDCDRILRIKCTTSTIRPDFLIDFLQESGIKAEILGDNCP